MTKVLIRSSALVLSLGLAAAPALACERHQQHQVSAPAQEVASTVPPVAAHAQAPATSVIITPAAAPQQSLQVKTYGGRDCNYSRTTQALTQ